MAGYSDTPLAKKLGIKAGIRVYAAGSPVDYPGLIDPYPDDVVILKRITNDLDLVHFFTRSEKELRSGLKKYLKRIQQNGAIWVSWPKKSSGVVTNVTEDVIRKVALPMGLVDIKVCAVDDTWSGLKLVIRKSKRKKT